MLRYLFILFLFLSFLSCHDNQSQPLPTQKAPEQNEEDIIYNYYDYKGQLHIAYSIEDIPEEYRDKVIITDMSEKPTREPKKVIKVADFSKGKVDETKYTYLEIDSSLPIGKGKIDPTQPEKKSDAETATGGESREAKIKKLKPVELMKKLKGVPITLYSTQECKPCYNARKFFTRIGVRHVEKNVDVDVVGKAEMMRKLQQSGLRAGNFPIIDIDGELSVGFDSRKVYKVILEKIDLDN